MKHEELDNFRGHKKIAFFSAMHYEGMNSGGKQEQYWILRERFLAVQMITGT